MKAALISKQIDVVLTLSPKEAYILLAIIGESSNSVVRSGLTHVNKLDNIEQFETPEDYGSPNIGFQDEFFELLEKALSKCPK
jgi:hypothetical protein